jgi:hypothetical protein
MNTMPVSNLALTVFFQQETATRHRLIIHRLIKAQLDLRSKVVLNRLNQSQCSLQVSHLRAAQNSSKVDLMEEVPKIASDIKVPLMLVKALISVALLQTIRLYSDIMQPLPIIWIILEKVLLCQSLNNLLNKSQINLKF